MYSVKSNCPESPNTVASGAERGLNAIGKSSASKVSIDMIPGVNVNCPPSGPNGSMYVHPQTGPGDAPLITPVQGPKQSAKIEASTQVGVGVGVGAGTAADCGLGLPNPKGEVPGPPKGDAAKGGRTGRTQRFVLGSRTRGGGHRRPLFPFRLFGGAITSDCSA